MQVPAIMAAFIPNTTNNMQSPAAAPQAADEVAEHVHESAPTECVTCANRYYQDDSMDGGVSMQQPTRIHPSMAASEVMGHEREHQARNARFAKEDGHEVIMNIVRLHTSLCPECGRNYVSGGETITQTRERSDEDVPFEEIFASRSDS